MLVNLLRSLRPQQWLKNFAVLAAAFFAGQILHPPVWEKLFWGFVILSLASSGNYLLNDLLDKEKDRLHPLKSKRPITSGKVPEWIAFGVAVVLIASALYASTFFNGFFPVVIASFVAIQLAYSLTLKKIILVDVMAIAATFSLRVFAGAFIIPVPISAWLILTTVSLALLISVGRRRAEVTLLTHRLASKHRDVITHYPNILLDGITFMMASSTLIAYALFTFNQPEVSTRKKLVELLPQTLSNPKWLMVTIPFVIYGIFRYLYVIYEKKEGSSPERILIMDLPLLIAVIGWTMAAYIAIYILVK